MAGIHGLIAQSVVLYFALLGIWGVIQGLRKAPLDSAYRGALVVGGVLGVIQLLVGVALIVAGRRPRDDLHYLYGLCVIITLPLIHQYLAGRRWRAPLVYGLGCLFIMGLGIRAITTGSPL